MKNTTNELIQPLAYGNVKPLEIRIYRYIGNSDKDVYHPERQYSNRDYNRAGQLLINNDVPDSDKDEAYKKLSEWRALHQVPLNIVYQTLKQNVAQIDLLGTIAQRSKRLPSILRKLNKLNTELTQIQDIGGCRAIVGNMSDVNELIKLTLLNKDYRLRNNYILEPKADGYRCAHLIYTHPFQENSAHNGLKIELQLRTRPQHAWATALETVDVFTNQALKFGGGTEDWKRFFALMSSYLARIEKTPIVNNTPKKLQDLVAEIEQLDSKLHIKKTLESYSHTTTIPEEYTEAGYLILELYPHQPYPDVIIFNKDQYQAAVEHYIRDERMMAHANINIVLVAVESLKALLEAYPNYFGDTKLFLIYLDMAIKSHFQK